MANALETEAVQNLLKLLMQNATWANVGDASGLQPSASAGSLYLSLHTGDPSGGNQTTSEVTYTSYARVAIARNSTKFPVASRGFTNGEAETFPSCTGADGQTATYAAIGTASSGTGHIIMSGPLTSSLLIVTGQAPNITASAIALTL